MNYAIRRIDRKCKGKGFEATKKNDRWQEHAYQKGSRTAVHFPMKPAHINFQQMLEEAPHVQNISLTYSVSSERKGHRGLGEPEP